MAVSSLVCVVLSKSFSDKEGLDYFLSVSEKLSIFPLTASATWHWHRATEKITKELKEIQASKQKLFYLHNLTGVLGAGAKMFQARIV